MTTTRYFLCAVNPDTGKDHARPAESRYTQCGRKPFGDYPGVESMGAEQMWRHLRNNPGGCNVCEVSVSYGVRLESRMRVAREEEQ